jgi:hypothetical protein
MALGMSDIYGDQRSFDGYRLDVDIVLKNHQEWSLGSLQVLAERL